MTLIHSYMPPEEDKDDVGDDPTDKHLFPKKSFKKYTFTKDKPKKKQKFL